MYCKGACSGNIGCDLPPGAQAAVVGSPFLERVGNPPARWVGSPKGFCAQVSFQRPGSAGPCAHSPGRADGCPTLAFLRKIGEGRPTSWLNFELHWELGLCCAAMSGGTVRSLGKGSAPPGPVPEGLIRVYSMRFCPYAKRTLLVLRAKGIRHEVININLKNKPEWFFKKNPLGLVPVLETSLGQLIYESAITCEYLDEAYPGKKLLPGDPYEKACQKMVFESFSKKEKALTAGDAHRFFPAHTQRRGGLKYHMTPSP
ncbi:uncharacterized protein LOC129636607 isoform X3 [Bubalus kerabau]|uniref:uncharacterized protein LOC129636607 isoform X3 n=1 Tax=Bubalus carabanensis TaxID=3119969 RepID=UPI00244E7B71|nr:uncharacterized protein LOC129636607 isoform X3 [Bubalus carabanensis]